VIVTGATVVLPLLRQSQLKTRPAKISHSDGIAVDPLGVLLAVFACEILLVFNTESSDMTSVLLFFTASIIAVPLRGASGRTLGWMFETGYVPEFLTSPAVFAVVIFSFTLADEIVHGTGLLAVVAMGMVLANSGINSLSDFRHFKENMSLLLISAIFIMLAASMDMDTVIHIFSPLILGYVLLMMFAVRPLSIFLSTIGSGLSLQEKSLVGWIASCGIVAMTVSSYYANILNEAGYEDAQIVTTLTF